MSLWAKSHEGGEPNRLPKCSSGGSRCVDFLNNLIRMSSGFFLLTSGNLKNTKKQSVLSRKTGKGLGLYDIFFIF